MGFPDAKAMKKNELVRQKMTEGSEKTVIEIQLIKTIIIDLFFS